MERALVESAASIYADERVRGFARNGHRVGNDDAATDAMRDDEQAVDAVAGTAVALARDHRFGDRVGVIGGQPHRAQLLPREAAQFIQRHPHAVAGGGAAHVVTPGFAVTRRMPKTGPAVLRSCGTTRTRTDALPFVSAVGTGYSTSKNLPGASWRTEEHT